MTSQLMINGVETEQRTEQEREINQYVGFEDHSMNVTITHHLEQP